MTIAWYDPTNHHVSTDKHDPLFTPLGQLLPLDVPREWVGLTDDAEILAISNTMPYADRFEFARAIETVLKERNA